MTSEKILEVIDKYDDVLRRMVDSPRYSLVEYVRVSHCITMLSEMRQLLSKGRVEKACRWLGFIQGVLWSLERYSIDALREHNRASHK